MPGIHTVEGTSLYVSALWHQEVHRSRVTALALSAGGTTLYSGCDAAAPKLEEQAEAAVKALSPLDGALLRAHQADGVNVRWLVHRPADGELVCVTSDGSLLCFCDATGSLSARTSIPNTCAALPSLTPPLPAEALPVCVGAAATTTAAEESRSAPPPFLAQSGYRGQREGYLFRQGSLGVGYYRKDVVLRYAPAAPTQDAMTAESGAGEGSCHGKQERMRSFLQRAAKSTPGLRCALTSPDGSLLFTSSPQSSGSDVLVWRLEHGGKDKGLAARRVAQLAGHTAPVLSLALSPDGCLLHSGSYDCTVRVWRTADWTCAKVLTGHGGGIRALALSPDGHALYSAAADNTVRAWSTKLWVCLRTLQGRHEDATWPCCMAMHPGSPGTPPLLVTASTGPFGASTLKAFRLPDGTCLATFAQLSYDQRGDVSALAFSPDGSTLYSGASDGTVAAWRLRWEAPTDAGPPAGLRRGFL